MKQRIAQRADRWIRWLTSTSTQPFDRLRTALSTSLGGRWARPDLVAGWTWSASLRNRLVLSLLLVLCFLFPLLDRNPRDVDAVTNAGIFIMLALGLNIVVGFAGLLDIGYAAFFAIGAYTYGILASMQLHPVWSDFWEPLARIGFVSPMVQGPGLPDLVRFHFNFWVMLPVAALVAALFGLLFGAPTLRLKGDYLAIVTLAFGEIVPVVIRNTQSVTGGAMGLTGVRTPSLFGFKFGFNPVPYYYLVLMEVILINDFAIGSEVGTASFDSCTGQGSRIPQMTRYVYTKRVFGLGLALSPLRLLRDSNDALLRAKNHL